MACHLLSLGISEDELLAVSLLHDVCEDCGYEPEYADLAFLVKYQIVSVIETIKVMLLSCN